ncbi:MAG: hypothetical protein HY397_02000 [Candidatus Doudnabacteria bacterium]|nr:hypothetical protein [Candidatus Doudnabacteria bacterium]
MLEKETGFNPEADSTFSTEPVPEPEPKTQKGFSRREIAKAIGLLGISSLTLPAIEHLADRFGSSSEAAEAQKEKPEKTIANFERNLKAEIIAELSPRIKGDAWSALESDRGLDLIVLNLKPIFEQALQKIKEPVDIMIERASGLKDRVKETQAGFYGGALLAALVVEGAAQIAGKLKREQVPPPALLSRRSLLFNLGGAAGAAYAGVKAREGERFTVSQPERDSEIGDYSNRSCSLLSDRIARKTTEDEMYDQERQEEWDGVVLDAVAGSEAYKPRFGLNSALEQFAVAHYIRTRLDEVRFDRGKA